MDSGHVKTDKKNPRETASIFSIIFTTFSFQLYKKRFEKELTLEDLWVPLKDHRSDILGTLLERKWKEELSQHKLTGKKPNLLRALLKTFCKPIVCSGLTACIVETCVRVCQPLLLGRMLRYFSSSHDIPFREALMYAIAILILSLLYTFFLTHYSLLLQNTAMEMKVAISSVVYGKVLRLSNSTFRSSFGGNVLNLISADTKMLKTFVWFLHYLWLSPILLTAVSYFIWIEVGWPGIAGLSIVFSMTALVASTERLAYSYRKLSARESDKRIRLIQEVLLGVRLIKMYTWEKPFTTIVNLVRTVETRIMKKTGYIRGIYLVYTLCIYRVVCFCLMVTMTFLGICVTAENVFTTAAFFTSAIHLCTFLIRSFQETTDTIVSMKRIEKFLLQEEMGASPNAVKKVIGDATDDAVIMNRATASWDMLNNKQTLSNINIRVKNGSLVAIIGPVGCGKSSLVQAMLGELELQSGVVSVEGKMSYASQEPWVFGDTVRQNIIFSRPYQKELYERVVEVCALEPDFLLLPHGDMTRVGERGCSLSGGQKARINLARAVYHEADVYFFDDPLSAVDAHVAKHLFDECIMSYLKGKTRLLVTHQLQYLKDADLIVVLKDGKVEIQGSFEDLMKSNFDSTKYLKSQENRQRHVDSKDDTDSQDDEIKVLKDFGVSFENVEASSEGKLEKSAFHEYLLSGASYFHLFVMGMLFLLSQLVANTADYWMLYWTKHRHTNETDRYMYTVSQSGVSDSEQEFMFHSPQSLSAHEDWTSTATFCMEVHGAVVAVLLFLAVARIIMFYNISESCSNNIHHEVMKRILRTYLAFFDVNPSGRMLNRLSTDVSVMDETLPRAMMDTAQQMLQTMGPFVVAAIVNYWLLIPIAIIAVMFCTIMRIFLRTSMNIMRLEGIARSPVFVHMNATIQGLTTIRTLKAEDVLRKEFDQHQDLNTSATYALNIVAKTLTLSVDLMCYMFFTTVIASFFIMDKRNYGGEVGLVITQTFGLFLWLQHAIVQFSSVPESMTCVERVMEYKYLKEENNLDTTSDNAAPPCWPGAGCIEFRNLSLKYADNGPRVLEDIHIVINTGDKVGIVGRTGAGKSSLILALFRFAKVEGSVLIDGVDTKDVSLHDLRKKISIIPQDPFLFSGTLRENLDRFDEFQDEELWRALEDVDMKGALKQKNGLGMKVADKGDNFSVGQKQLLCLARAILRKNKILVLDEATANVDLQTDELIQKTLREKFSDCTVLTVAHRLNTIMDSDKVIVMSDGRMVEFDHPHLLLKNAEGVFFKMVQKTGQLEKLVAVASESYIKLMESRKQR